MNPMLNNPEKPLSEREETLLAELEAVIDTHVKGYVSVGLALKEIRDQRLYRINYPIFEDYLFLEWDMTKKHGYRLIEAAEVYTNLKGFIEETLLNPKVSHGTLLGDEEVTHGLLFEGPDVSKQLANLLPKNERQARPLTEYSPEKQREIWLLVLDKASAPGSKITATFIIQVILEMERKEITKRINKNKDRTNKEQALPPLVKTTYMALLQVVQNQNDEDWQAVGKPTMISLLEDLLADLKHF